MDQDDKIEVILEALGDQAEMVIVCAGIAWQCHLVRFSAYRVATVARVLGGGGVRVARTFHLDEIEDLAIIAEDPGGEAPGPELSLAALSDDLVALAAVALERQQSFTHDAVDRALRAAKAKLKGQEEDGSSHHRSAAGPGPGRDDRLRPAADN